MKKEKKRNFYAVRKPLGLLYWFAVNVMSLYFRLIYGLRLDRSQMKGLKAPVLVLSNHESNFDFFVSAFALYPLKLHFMVSTYFFHHSLLGRLLYLMGCVPKKQFVPDTSAIKTVLRLAENKENICIFPEGQTCYTGEVSDIDMSTAKLVKKLGITTAAVTVRGNHLTFPKWANGRKYPSRVEGKAKIILTPEQIKELSLCEIEQILSAALYYNDFEWQRETMAKSRKPRTTDGLENIVYRCPKCNRDFAMRSDKGRKLICESCGYSVVYNDYGFFETENNEKPVYDNSADWFNFERRAISEEIDSGGLPFVCDCSLGKTVEGKQGYTPCGEGTMTLDEKGIHFVGTKNGEPFEVGALYEHQTTLPHNAGLCAIDIHGVGENYALIPDDRRKMIKFVEGYLIMRKRRDAEMSK